MIQMHEVFSMADSPKFTELIFSTECLLIVVVFSGTHSELLSKLLKLTEINELYSVRTESDP